MGQNLTEDSGRLETQEKVTVLDQRQSAGEPGRANTAGKSKGNLNSLKITSCSGEPVFCLFWPSTDWIK